MAGPGTYEVYEAILPIEQAYEPHELETATAGRRLAAYSLDFVIAIFTLIVGWFIWFAFTAPNGQTPGKNLVGLYIIKDDGTRAGGGYTWLREAVVKNLLFSLLSAASSGIVWLVGSLWLLWDRDRQCLWDKITSTHIAYSPNGFKPETIRDQAISGQTRRRTPGQQQNRPVGSPGVAGVPGSPNSVVADQPTSAVGDRLRELQQLRTDGLITPEEYEVRRAELVKAL